MYAGAVSRGSKMAKMSSNFLRMLQVSFLLQYVVLSVPPYSIRRGKTIAISKMRAWIELMLTILGAAIEIGAIMFLYTYTKNFSLYNVLSYLKSGTSLAFSFAATYELITSLNQMKSILEQIKILDSVIALEKKELTQLGLKLVILILTVVSAVVLNLAIMISYGYPIRINFVLIFSSIRFYLQPFAIQVQFFSLMSLVVLYINWINKQLAKIDPLLEPGKTEKCISHNETGSNIRGTIDCEIASEVDRLRKVYERVNDLKTSINNAYSLRLWLDTIHGAVQFMCFLYYGIVQLKNNPGLGDTETKIDFSFLVYEAATLTLIFIQKIQICDRVAEAGNSVGVSVHRVFSWYSCEKTRQELTTFSLELLHRDSSVRAYKFFIIDYKLIAEILSGIVMMIIALMQFEFAGSKEENNAMNDFIADV